MKKAKDKKRKYKVQISILFWIVFVFIIIILCVDIGLGIIYLDTENWISILTTVTKDLITTVIISIIIGIFVKMINEKYFAVRRNDRLLKSFGVSDIGTGKSSLKDVHNIFGNKTLNIFPQEIHMLYITGNIYLEKFKGELIECLKHGCIIKLLLVSTEQSNIDFVRRLEEIYGKEEGEYVKQIEAVKKLVNELNKEYPEQISIRFYKDEYFYNFRSAKYLDSKKDVVFYKSNINLQPFNTPAVDVSIGLSGTYKSTDDLDKNIFYLNDQTFDKLWAKYEETV